MIVLDTSFLVAYKNDRDDHHGRAMDVVEDLVGGRWGRVLLPEYVLAETATVLGGLVDLDAAVEMAHALLTSREIDLIPCARLLLDGLDIYERQDRFRLSFFDATIVAVARVAGADHVATFDRGFEGVEGIRVVPEAG